MQIPVKDLREALELVQPAVPKKATLPICMDILLVDGQARATNLEVGVTVHLGQETGDPILLPFALAYEFLKRVPGNGILTLTQGKGSVILESGRSRAVLNDNQVVEEFPPVPEMEEPATAVLDGTVLVRGLMEAIAYTAKEESRPVLTSVCLALGDPVEVVAADGFRLARLRLNASLPHHEGKLLLLPRGAVRVLAHLWKSAGAAPDMGLEGSVADLATAKRLLRLEYDLGKHLARFTFGKVCLYTQLVEGTFPNYGPLIPTDLPQRASFMAGDMRQALDLVREVARGGSGIVRLSWEGEDMTVMATATEMGEVTAQVRLLVPCTAAGKIAIDVKYLVEYFKGQEGIVSMGVSSPSAPALFTTAGMPDVVMMPMFVQWDGEAPKQPAPEAPTGQSEEATSAQPIPAGEGQEAASEPAEGAEIDAPTEETKPRRRGRKKQK